jgi:glyoxylase I family protein
MIELFHHVCVETNRYEESLSFWRCLGFNIETETSGFHGRDYNTWLACGDIRVELQTPKRPATRKERAKILGIADSAPAKGDISSLGIVHVCFTVRNLDTVIADVQARGFYSFKRKNGAIRYDVEGCGLCKLVAPEGTIVELRER